jgi:UDP-N-acetylmuramate dehydrogenase
LSGIILAATLVFKKADPREIDAVFQKNLRQRNASQPGSVPSAGCFFKNPDQGMSAGQLIDKSGLKGFRINDAIISDIHANYIINAGSAKCADILQLQHHIQNIVFQKFKVNLEPEVRMEGE